MTDADTRAGRFIPASELDFNRYAKNLAWLLNESLSQSKEVLAKLYGFASCHEIRQVFAQGLAPGPFSQTPNIPSFSGEPPIMGGPDCVPRTDPRYAARHQKLWWLFRDRDGSLVQRRRLLALIEAGFFCAPKEHKALFKRVLAGLQAFESGDPDTARDWLEKNWPIGYWAVLEMLYEKDLKFNNTISEKLTRFGGVSPAQAYEKLWQFKAARIYSLIVEGVPSAIEFDPVIFDEQVPPRKKADAPGLFDFHICTEWEVRCNLDAFFEEDDEAEFDTLMTALRSGDYDLSRHRKLREKCTKEELANMAADLRAARYAELKGYADGLTSSHGLVEELLIYRQCWPLSEANLAIAAYTAANPGKNVPDELRFQQINDKELLETYVSLRTVANECDFEEECVQILVMDVGFYLTHADAKEGAKELVGGITGFLLIPFNSNYSCNENGWFYALDSSSAMLNDVWKVLQVDYFPGQGMRSIEEFTVDRPFKSIAVTDIELIPKYRGLGITPYLFRYLKEAIADREYSAVDENWFVLSGLLAFNQIEVDEIDTLPPRSGARSIGEPIAFVIPVEGAEPVDRIIRPHLNSSLVRQRKNPRDPKERQKRKLMAHFKAMESDVVDDFYDESTIHIVCYDPYEWPAT